MNFFCLFNFKNQRNLVYFLAITIAILLNSCSNQNKSPDISFYYWKTRFSLSTFEANTLKTNGVKNLYLRYFDIDINENGTNAVPISPVIFEQKTEKIRIIPVVYIKNRVFLNKHIDIDQISKKTIGLINQINKKNNIVIDEIQLDCDWSKESCENYFNFINKIKEYSKLKLSATIRLHQVKYYLETKIPDVDHGVLMYYNMGRIDSVSLNSIYDKSIAEKYLNSLANYPLQLDVALPVFSWGVHIREDKVINLISKLVEKSLETDSVFKKKSENRYIAKMDHIKFGFYFKKGDEIKIEITNFNDLKEMASDLGKKMRKKPGEVIFYDLDSTNLMRYNNEKQAFKKIADYF